MNKVQKQRLIEELAKLRHDQMRSWSRNFFVMLNNFKYEGKSLDDFGTEMLKLCKDNWVEYHELPEELKKQSRTFAMAVLQIVDKHSQAK
jgi:hypothetical protein